MVTPDASLVIFMGADIASYPKRNYGCPRKSNHQNISPSFKVRAGIKLLNAGLCAYSLVLLTGDVSRNPGPANISQDSQNFSDIGFPSKGPVTLLRMRETYEKRMKINAIIFIRTKIL